MKVEKATFAGGCFWHVQFEFSCLPGVIKTIAGYTGGKTEDPTYQEVHSGKTGHVEAVEVQYDSDRISFDKLLEKFFQIHDPTTINKQGLDIGPQYNSAIFYSKRKQKERAEAYINNLRNQDIGVVTEIKPLTKFYRAEEYHQNYFKKTSLRQCII
ncbi:MAG: peptide-methionine (S)-S-oxide reductase MsrA [Patescibacteria group bacterium]|nr:peptide-methionine (S)-S-oxide reductase MsrA [Patescibacteria group bacterium]